MFTSQPLTFADPGLYGASAAGDSGQHSQFSADSQLIAFESDAGNLTSNDFNGQQDIFVRDLSTGTNRLVSVTPEGTSANGRSYHPILSADGRFVVFESEASNLVPGDVNGLADVFAHDLQTGTVEMVNVNTGGTGGGNGYNIAQDISADGRLVAFLSDSSNLVDTPVLGNFGDYQVYVRDLIANTTTLVSINATGTAGGNSYSGKSTFSPDGRYLAFQSKANDLVSNDFGESDTDVFLRDLQLGTTTLISTNSDGTVADNGDAYDPVFSPDGTKLAYVSEANDVLVSNPSGANVYLTDLSTGTKTLVSDDNLLFDNQVLPKAQKPVFSPDGRYIAYESEIIQGNLVEILARDLQTNTTILVSANKFSDQSADHISDGLSTDPVFSADSGTIYFAGTGTILVEEDSGGIRQIYARDLATKTTRIVSRKLDDSVGNGPSSRPVIAPDGSILAWQSQSTGVVLDDNNARQDLFFWDTTTEATSLASVRSPALPPEFTSATTNDDDRRFGAMGSDGRYVVYVSESTELVPNFVQGENVYRYDRDTGITELVSINSDGTGGLPSHTVIGAPKISGDGRFVVFASTYSEAVPGLQVEPGPADFLFVRDMVLGTTKVVNLNQAGKVEGTLLNEYAISTSGRYVAFTSRGGLTSADNNGLYDVYTYDMQLDTLELVSVATGGDAGDGHSRLRETSDNSARLFGGNDQYLVFNSQATDLVAAGGAGGSSSVYVRDLKNNLTMAVSVDASGVPVPAEEESISADGSRVVFSTFEAIAPEDENFAPDVYVREIATGTNIWVSGADPATPDGTSPLISADGQTVLFIFNPEGSFSGLALRDLQAQSTTVVLAEGVFQPTLSADGRTVTFKTSLELTPNDSNNFDDLFVYDVPSQTTTLVSINQSGTGTANRGVHHQVPLVSDDGSVIVYASESSDLAPLDINGRMDLFAYTREIGSSSLRGEVFADLDGDGTRDPDEEPLSGWKVFLDIDGNGTPSNGEPELLTDANGQYAFNGLLPGGYTVAIVIPAGFAQTTPPSDTHIVQLGEDETVSGLNFGAQQLLPDLVVDSITSPTTGEPGRELTVGWQVTNTSPLDIVGNWQDAVYLSADETLDARDVLLTTVPHTGGLGAGLAYQGSATITTPSLVPGGYFVIVQTDRRTQVVQTNRGNDVQTAAASVELNVPALTLDVPIADEFTTAGQWRYFQVASPGGSSLRIQVDSAASDGATAVYVRRGALPTPGMFDVRGQLFQPDAEVIVPQTVAGSTYYVLVESQFGGAATAEFTVTAEVPDLEISQVSPARGGNAGRVTVQIDGAGFSPNATVQLTAGGTSIAATSIDYRNSTQFFATFDLTGEPLGTYDVEVSGDEATSAPDAFEIVEAEETPLDMKIIVQPIIRRGRAAPVIVEVKNTGNTDMPAPILQLSSDVAFVRLSEDSGLERTSRLFMAASPDGPAGIIRAGQTVRVPFYISSPIGNGASVGLTLSRVDEEQSIDFVALGQASQPPFVSSEAWDIIWSRVTASLGGTAGGIRELAAAGADYLGRLGISTSDPERLIALAVQQADNALLGPILSSDLELSPDVPGLSLDFGRVNLQTIQGRYRLGPLGYGWAHSWENRLTTDELGNVYLDSGGIIRVFTLQVDGSYVGGPRDAAELKLSGGTYTLREVDGTSLTFRQDGLLDFARDPRNNRVTASYDSAGLLTRLTHTSGETLDFSYNANGRLTQVADSTGGVVVFAYDGSEHLTSATTSQGTVSYNYVPGGDASTNHALATVTNAGGAEVNYSYDSQGRLMAIDGGTLGRTDFAYTSDGHVISTDAAGGQTEYTFDDNGDVVVIRDAVGGKTLFAYDSHHFAEAATKPNGATTEFTHTSSGSLTHIVDSLRGAVSATYDPLFQALTSFQDERGITTQFEIDSSGNTVGIRYADGTRESLAYDAQGNLTGTTRRDGQSIQYTYDAAGRVTSEILPNGDIRSFSYDARGNLLSATDNRGTTEMEYNSADQLTLIEYPDGRFISYTYDTGGQITRANQNGFVVEYAYDISGNLTNVTEESGALLAHYAYDTRGNVVLKQLGNGTYTTFAYDTLGQLTTLVNHAPDDSINSSFNYAYDNVGQVVSVTTLEGVTTYGYDLTGQLTSVVLPSGRTILYEYDASGNRVKVTDNGVVTLYTTNNLNQYTQVGNTTFTYDANGNLATRTDGAGTTYYTFNVENQLVSVDGPNGTFTYEYDVFGNRIAEIQDGVRREFLISPLGLGDILAEYDDQNNPIGNYAIGKGLIGQFNDQGGFYFDFDAVGSTKGLTDAAGGYVNEYAYLPFGETDVLQETVPNSFRYVGEQGIADRGHGLLDMRARHYDPAVGQFVSDDPIGLAANDPNVRRYVWNNPVSYIDPSGLIGDGTSPSLPSQVDTIGLDRPHTVREVTVDPNTGRITKVKNLPMTNEELAKYNANRAERAKNLIKNDPTLKEFAKGKPSANRLERWLRFKAGAGRVLGWASRAAPWVGLGLLWWEVANHYVNTLREEFTTSVGSTDPNDIVGPAGFGSQNYVTADQTFPYTIHYENDPEQATAPAQEVFITHQLDADLDWTTFELGDFGFGSTIISVPADLQQYQAQIDYQNQDGSPLRIDAMASFDLQSGLVTWTFRSVDPATGALPEGVFDGFLPVNDATGRGEGFVTFLVHPKADLPTGTSIDAQAAIVFDDNDPVITNLFTNTIDAGSPTSSVMALPERSLASFEVSWAGSDDNAGSGIASYDVYVSVDGGAYSIWLENETAASAVYAGEFGHNYAFYSVATDNVGNRELPPTLAQAVTAITGWQNPVLAYDVDVDSDVDVIDAVIVINALLTQGEHSLDGQSPPPPPYIDLDGDNDLDVVDAVLLINYLLTNGLQSSPAVVPAPAETEPAPLQTTKDTSLPASAHDAVLASDDWQPSPLADDVQGSLKDSGLAELTWAIAIEGESDRLTKRLRKSAIG